MPSSSNTTASRHGGRARWRWVALVAPLLGAAGFAAAAMAASGRSASSSAAHRIPPAVLREPPAAAPITPSGRAKTQRTTLQATAAAASSASILFQAPNSNPPIMGQSQETGYTGGIDVINWSWGTTTPAAVAGAKPIPSQVTVQGVEDSAGPALALYELSGKVIPSVVMTELGSISQSGIKPVYSVTLTSAILTSYTISGAVGADGNTWRGNFAYSVIAIKHYVYDPSGVALTPTCVTYNVTANTTSNACPA